MINIKDVGHSSDSGNTSELGTKSSEDLKTSSQYITKAETFLKYPILKLGAEKLHQQMQDRDTQRLIKDETARGTEALIAAQENARLSTVLTAIASVAALFALLISLAAYRLAFSDDEHDRKWRAEQRQLAAEQVRVMKDIREHLLSQ